MTIQEAAESLIKHLNDPETFIVYVVEDRIRVDVNWIYRVGEAEAIGDTWEGFPVFVGRRSCW